MILGAWTPLQWLALVEHELLLFAGVFFLVGSIDELAIDFAWVWLRLTGRARTLRIRRENHCRAALAGSAALIIPAWHEERILATTIAHALAAWPQPELRLYAGCYRNDVGTAEAIAAGARGDPRVRLVVHDRDGPTTKADCLNRLYAAMEADERRCGVRFRMVLVHDAEDMVDPAALSLIDAAMARADFVQLPVLPEPQPESRWIGSHYCEEFAEAHGKSMVVRGLLGAALPAAGVGCAFARELIGAIAETMDGSGPFSVESLTEDYELGLKIKAAGGTAWFLRARGEDGRLVATRAFFPPTLPQAVRQKARWVHGIALQGWDRLGWSGGVVESWMRLRDRRGPLTALVLFAAYVLLALAAALSFAEWLGFGRPWEPSGLLLVLVWANLASFLWRAAMRFAFTAREYGWAEGVRAVLRLPFANVIAIMAGRRALVAYVKTLLGTRPRWEKTHHHAHPADFQTGPASA
ncbi:MAG TPA: glycosyl transferase family protein [Croceibacterium sp.]|jgi:adsorption protein B